MTDSILDLLKYVLLALIYLFFARVLWAVWSEVRRPTVIGSNPPSRQAADTTPPGGVDTKRAKRTKRATKESTATGRAQRLVVIEPKAYRGRAWPIDAEITIGRSAAATITIPDDTYVSSLHARIFDHDGQPMVEDLNSTNGSFHNGNRITGVRLLHRGDRIQVGSTILEAQ